MATAGELFEAMADYREARIRLLQLAGVARSNREPLSEFSERLVAAAWGGTCSTNRNEPGWDVRLPDETTVQVKVLANSASNRTNMHKVRDVKANHFAIVMFEDLHVLGIVMMPRDGLVAIGTALKKTGKVPLTEGWNFTYQNWLKLSTEPQLCQQLKVQVRLPPDFTVT